MYVSLAIKLYCNGMIKHFSTLAYPFCFCMFCVWFSLFAMIINFIGWSICEKSSWSSRWWRFRCL